MQVEIPEDIPDSLLANRAINSINELISEGDKSKNKLRTAIFFIDRIKNEPLSVEQAEQIVSFLVDRDQLPFEPDEMTRTMLYTLTTYQKLAVKKLIEAMRHRYELTSNLDELKKLNTKLSYKIQQVDMRNVSMLKMKIESKISKLRTEKVMFDYENIASKNLLEIVKIIVSNDDKKDMAPLIENALQEIRGKQSNEGYRKDGGQQEAQLYYKIVKVLEKKSAEYPIENPEKCMDILERYFCMGVEKNIRAVVHNYIERKEFKQAHALCRKYMNCTGNESTAMDNLKNEIIKAEIGEIILKGIHANATLDEQNAFFEVLEKRMREKKYSYSTIPLGYNKDGTKKITLADIWEDERVMSR